MTNTCPHCGKDFGYTSFQYCPYCGKLTSIEQNPTTANTPSQNVKSDNNNANFNINPYKIIAIIGLVTLLIALPVPWISVNVLGQYNLSLVDIYRSASNAWSQPSQSSTGSAPDFSRYVPSVAAMFLTIVLFPLAIIFALVSIFYPKVSIGAGISGILSGVLWIFGIDSLKSVIVQEMINQGATTFTQQLASIIYSAITFGYGALISIVGGVVFLVAFFYNNKLITPATKVEPYSTPKFVEPIKVEVAPQPIIKPVQKTNINQPLSTKNSVQNIPKNDYIPNVKESKREEKNSVTISGKALLIIILLIVASLGGGAFGGYTYSQTVSKLEYQISTSKLTEERDKALNNLSQLQNNNSILLTNNTLLKQQIIQLLQQNNALTNENNQLRQQLTSGTITPGQTIKIGYIAATTTAYETAKPYLEQIVAPDLTNYVRSLGYNINVQFLIENANGQANTHLEKIQNFKSMGVTLVIGGGWSSQAQASLAYANSNNMLLVSTSSTSPTLAIANDRLFRMCPADSATAPALADILWSYGIKRVIIIQRGDSWGDGIVNLFVPVWKAKGGNIAGDIVRYAAEATDFSNYLQQANGMATAANAANGGNKERVGVLLLSFDEFAIIATQCEDYPSLYNCPFFGADGTAISTRGMTDAPNQVNHMRVFSLLAQEPSTASYNSMKARYEALTGQQFSVYSAYIYDAAWAILQTSLFVGSTDASKVVAAFPSVCNSMNGISGPCKLNEYGDRVPPPFNIWYYASGPSTPSLSYVGGVYYPDTKVTIWDISGLQSKLGYIPQGP
ncbi:MAG: ABC transporter substrate-binding protein [Candidatus Bathyarchaeota archaeon]|nr:ABC transporter substrate-binding protein [Candidatus Bathyarchaeota archaeon]